MGDANVLVGSLEEVSLVLAPEGFTTTAADHAGNIDSHLANRTADNGLIFLPSGPILGRVRVRELQVRRHLLEVPDELIGTLSPLELARPDDPDEAAA